MFEIRNNKGPECPHCGYVEDPSEGDYYENYDNVECSECENIYNMKLHTVYTWISKN